MSPQYTTVGGYPNTDPYYISPEEEAAMNTTTYENAPHGEMLHLAQKAHRLECALIDAHAQITASIPHCEEWRAVELTRLLSRIDRVLEDK